MNSCPTPLVMALAFVINWAVQPVAHAQLAAPEAQQIARDVYIFGYPLITMEMTRRVMTNVATPEALRGPMGRFLNARQYPTAAFKDVTAPNADTLYSTAWIDVSQEPYILSLPDEHDRYYLMPMLSGWTDVFEVPGKRTTGTKAQKYAITGPGWKGTLPKGVTRYDSPTGIVWILGRTYCTGTAKDYQAVHSLQDQYSIVPLSAYGKPYTPPAGKVDPQIDMKTPVREQVHALSVEAYFSLLARLLKNNPPAPADAPLVKSMAKLGIVPGKEFTTAGLNAETVKMLQHVPKMAQEQIMGYFGQAGKVENGWQVMTSTGIYGTNYLQRAFVTAIGLGANRPQDAVYPTTQVDTDGQALDGANKYVMHFSKGQTPPVKGFWSLTMYNDQYFFVDNELNKYTVSPRDDLKYNDDGSLDLYLQTSSPGKEKESNWLPAPAGKFILMLRLYWPREDAPSIIDGSWRPPGVTKSS